MTDFKAEYDSYLSDFNRYAEEYFAELSTRPLLLKESMQYTFACGGKRIRPVIMLSVGEVLGISRDRLLPFALALEMIHTYSLIHDDLPCMDNDDYRRGQPSSHVKFGEGNALLAGDALLNTAHTILLQESKKGKSEAEVGIFMSDAAGIFGMIGGQSADLAASEKDHPRTEEELFYIFENKTCKLFEAAVLSPCILVGQKADAFERFASSFGMLFQITDDLLDVNGDFRMLGKTIGKDAEENKFTSVDLYGVDGATAKADEYYRSCLSALQNIGNSDFLIALVSDVRTRLK